MHKLVNDQLLRAEYPSLGPIAFAKKYGLKEATVRNRAYSIKVRFVRPSLKETYCTICKKRLGHFSKKNNHFYASYSNTSGLCINCSSKIKYKKRGAFTSGKFFNQVEIDYIKKNYWMTEKKEICDKLNRNWSSITHKAKRLGLQRNLNFFRSRETIKFLLTNNPMKNEETRKKAAQRMKDYINNNPQKLLNRILKRNKITSLEKRVKYLLNKHNIEHKFNCYVKTKNSYKFPDFRIHNLIIECDGKRFHTDKDKEKLRNRELIEAGYELLHFSEGKINNNIDGVEKCILKKLSQLGILERSKLMI